MFSLENTYFEKLPEELIDYIWELNHYDAACVINYYSRKFITKTIYDLTEMINFAHFKAHLGLGMNYHKFFYIPYDL